MDPLIAVAGDNPSFCDTVGEQFRFKSDGGEQLWDEVKSCAGWTDLEFICFGKLDHCEKGRGEITHLISQVLGRFLLFLYFFFFFFLEADGPIGMWTYVQRLWLGWEGSFQGRAFLVRTQGEGNLFSMHMHGLEKSSGGCCWQRGGAAAHEELR